MINRSDRLGIDSSANFQIDDRTIQDKLQYLFKYTNQIIFQSEAGSEYQLDRDVLANHSTFSALCLNSDSNYKPNPNDEYCQYYDESDDDDKKNWPANGIELETLHLFLGFKNLNQGDTLSLFFNLTATNNNQIEWFYFDEEKADNEKWQPLDSSLIDTTNDLSVSGTWSAVWPVSHQSELAWIKGEFTKTNIEVSSEYNHSKRYHRWQYAGNGKVNNYWFSESERHAFIEFTLPKLTDIKNMTLCGRRHSGYPNYLNDATYHLIDEKGVELASGTIEDEGDKSPEVIIPLDSQVKGVKKIRLERQGQNTRCIALSGIKLDGEFITHDSAEVIGVNINGILTNATTWADFLFQGLSVTELAEQYQNPTGTLPPHQALLFAYLKMLETPQALMNRLPGKQRDLYYQGLLGLKPQAAKPGQVAVSVQLEEAFSNLMVPKGSLLQAGQDENGIDIEYQLDRDVLANHSTFSALYVSHEPCEDIMTAETESLFDDNSTDKDKKNWPTEGVTLESQYLFFGIKDLNPGDTLSLFWELTASSKHEVEWHYLDDGNRWRPLNTIFIDNTNGLSQSGTWSALWPEASGETSSRPDDGAFSADRKWIRAKGNFQTLRIGETDCREYLSSYIPENAIDGRLDTFYHSRNINYSPDEYLEVTFDAPSNLTELTVYFRDESFPGRHINGALVELRDDQNITLYQFNVVDYEGKTEKFFIQKWDEQIRGIKKIRVTKPDATRIAVAGFGVRGAMIGLEPLNNPITLKGILTNATTATLSNASQLTDTVTGQALPPESITALATDIQGVAEIVQPWQSWGGEAPESHSDFNARIPRQLSHRDRAISYADSILLIKDNFAYVYDVIANQNENSAINTVALVVIPRARSSDNGDVHQPALGRQKMDALRSFLTHRASAWTDVQVVNPKYNVVELESTVTFKAGVNPEYGKAQLTESLIQHYMPWVSDRELGPKVANQFNYYDVIAHIQQHPLVDNLKELELDKGTESISAESEEVLVFSTDSININEAN